MEDKVRTHGSTVVNVVLGVALIGVGGLALLGELFGLHLGRFLWPFFVIVPGALMFVLGLTSVQRGGEALTIPGAIITIAGLLLLYGSVTRHWESWAYSWALIAPAGPGVGLVAHGLLKSRPDHVRAGKGLIWVGLALFVAFGVFFELILGISGWGLGRFAWAVVLIGLGVALLLRAVLPRGKQKGGLQ